MNQELAIAIANALIVLLENIQTTKDATIDDAIAALNAAKEKTWEQYKAEAGEGITVVPAPAASESPAPPDATGA